MTHERLPADTRSALTFIDALYHEIALLIREVEDALEGHGFIIGKPSGYGVTTRSSAGLEPQYVAQWLSRSFTVFFVPAGDTTSNQGVTKTHAKPDLRLLLLHIELPGPHSDQARILGGVIEDIEFLHGQQKKFENFMSRFALYGHRMFTTPAAVTYRDSYFAFRGRFTEEPLFAMTDTATIHDRIVAPMLEFWAPTSAG